MAHWRRARPASSMPDTVQQDRIILLYEAMATTIHSVLAAARAEDWDSLVKLEAECAAQVATLQQSESLTLLSDQQNKKKTALVVQMLADDGAIRLLATARMTHLSNQIHSANTERKLSKAYNA
jgi:flagellar protein FliT